MSNIVPIQFINILLLINIVIEDWKLTLNLINYEVVTLFKVQYTKTRLALTNIKLD